MKPSFFKFLLIFVFIGNSLVNAQNTITSSGGDASGTGGSSSYSVGQIVYTSNTGTSGSVNQGVQQPYEIYVITGVELYKGINLVCSVYPNPAIDRLTLKMENEKIKDLSWQLYNIRGNLLKTQEITGADTEINFENLPPEIYLLKVLQAKTIIKSFKIIKK